MSPLIAVAGREEVITDRYAKNAFGSKQHIELFFLFLRTRTNSLMIDVLQSLRALPTAVGARIYGIRIENT